MKFLVVLAIAVACASADVSHVLRTGEAAAEVVSSVFNSSPEGQQFNYGYETQNKITAQAEGVVSNFNSENPTLEVKGSYGYVAPDGSPVQVIYTAGPNGFVAQGNHIPVAPEIPELIARSLRYIASKPAYVERTVRN